MSANKKVFTAKLEDETELELAVLNPSPAIQVEAQLAYNKAWRKAEENGSILRRNLDKIAEERNLWNNDIKLKVEGLENKVLELEKKLRGGANSFSTLEEAKDVALQIRKLREERASLIRPKLELDSFTAENFADLARTNYIIANTIVYNDTGKKYFKDYDDFIAQSNGLVALASAVAFFEFTIGQNRDDNYEDEFLKKYKYLDDKGRLINSNGHLITEDGKLINDKSQYVNENDELVDINGDRVDDKGNYLITFAEWTNG